MDPSVVGTIGTRAMLGAFGALGLDARRIQAEAGFEDEELVDPDRLLPVDRFYRIWELADRAWGRPGLGLHAGRAVPFGALEVLDYLLLTSPTVEEGMTQVARSFPLTTRTVRYEISLEDDHAVCAMVWRMSPRGIMFHLRDFSLAVFTGRIFHASGRRPERVELHGPPLAGEDEYARVFGAPTDALEVTAEDLARPDTVVQLGLPPRRIDLLSSVTGLDFDGAWTTRVTHDVGGCAVPFLGRVALVANKRAARRLKDLADLEALGEDPYLSGGAER